jgi:hypothetical protein
MRFLVVAGQLLLILAVIYLFDVEGRRYFFPVMCLAVGGFVVHAWLPARFRLGFFTLLSLAGILLFLGWPNGGWVLGIGGGLIAISYLPVPWIYRVLLIVLAAVLLAMVRVEHPEPFWPVLGAMFMFRLIVYLHDLRRAHGRPPLGHAFAYFFMLPNVCFTLFPVIDFRTFRATYRERDPHLGYQTGIEWIVRGLSHLLAYRLVKYFLMPAPHEIHDLPHLALFLATNYALYLRVSGHFHLITGILYLFGFNLPRTHYNYFLASSCSDIWRRINIYWKDFMTKVFFLPTFFTLLGLGTRPAMALAAFGVFVGTFLLHTYQVFWLLGTFPDLGRDAALWLPLGLVMAVNLQFDLARTARGSSPAPAFVLGQAVRHSLQVLGMFVLISLFWGLWTIPELFSSLSFPVISSVASVAGSLWLLAAAAGVVAAGVLVQWVRAELERRGALPLGLGPARSAAVHAVALGLAVLVGLPQVTALLEPQAARLVATLRLDAYTPLEARHKVEGYYEEIAQAPVQASAFMAVLAGRERSPAGTEPHYLIMSQHVDDFQGRELIPGWSGELGGKWLTINQLGMRDRPGVSQKRTPDTCRIALLGSSIVMGYGVADDEVFGRLVEDRLNAERREQGPRYELLNFGGGMFWAIQRRVVFDRKILAFEPDALYYVAHQDELLGPAKHLASLVSARRGLPYPYLMDVVQKAGITPDMSHALTESQLVRFGPEIVLGLYRDLVEVCRKRGILPVWIYLPVPGILEVSVKSSELVSLAQQAGFLVVNLGDWAAGYDPGDVKLTATDYHANALGHRLIAEQLFAVLRERSELLPAFAPLRGGAVGGP